MSVIVNVELDRGDFKLDVNCELGSGITGVYGPSGAGKTTLLHLISGLIKPTSGRLVVNGNIFVDTDKGVFVPVHKRNIGVVFQEGRLFSHMSVAQNLKYGLKFKSKKSSEVSFDTVVEMLEIGHLLDREPSMLSGGERQRVAIGRTLLTSPQLLLLDEPFSAVDVGLRQQIIPYIRHIHKTLHIPTLIISHDLPDIQQLTDQLLLIKSGSVAGNGSIHDLIRDKSLFSLMRGAGLVNVLELKVVGPVNEELTLLSDPEGGFYPIVEAPYLADSQGGDTATISISPEDISLSLNKVEGISICNQISGIVKNVIEAPHQILCQIDIGKELIVEISQKSKRSLSLEEGKEIFVLFKKQSITIHSTRSSSSESL